MSDPTEQPRSREAMLQRFAELTMDSAEDLLKRQIEAQTSAEAAQLAGALHRMGRALRQTFLVQDKLQRQAQAATREAEASAREAAAQVAAQAAKARSDALSARQERVRRPLSVLCAETAESVEQAEDLFIEAECRAASYLHGFETLSDEAIVDMVADDLGLTAGDDLPDADEADEADDPSARPRADGDPSGANPGPRPMHPPNGGASSGANSS